MVVIGADGCPGGGWVVASLDDAGITWHHVPDAGALLDLADRAGAAALALDVPIGLPDGVRACDAEARGRLGARRSSVFAAPPRRVLGCSTYAEARPLDRSLSAQAFGLVPRIRDVDEVLRARGPQVHRWLVECHPEVSFAELTGQVLPTKKSAAGALARLAALRGAGLELPVDAPPQGSLDDALDAAVCAWTARRWAAGQAQVLGGEADALGVPARIVV